MPQTLKIIEDYAFFDCKNLKDVENGTVIVVEKDKLYIKCSDGTLYLSAIKDYFNKEIVSLSTSKNNDISLIKESYKNFILKMRY